MTFPSIEHLSSQGTEVHILTKSSFVPIFQTHGVATQIHAISDHASFKELIAKVYELRELRFDQVYDLHRNLRSIATTFLVNGSSFTVRKFRIKEVVLFVLHRRIFQLLGLSPIDRAQAALSLVGGAVIDTHRALRRIPQLRDEIRYQIQKFAKGYICIAMESAWPQKEWSSSRFVEVAQKLAGKGFGIIWLGLRAVPREAVFDGSLDLTGELSLPEVATVLREASLLLCNDSGLMHLAESAGTPVVAIFGPTSRELGFAPRSKLSRVVEAELWCRPCSKTGRWCFRPFARRRCLLEVSVDQTMTAVMEVLEHRN